MLAPSIESGTHLKKVKHLVFTLGGLLLAQFFVASISFASDDHIQAKKLSGQCKTCHGKNGIAQIPIAPNIAGESADYLISQLLAFKSGQRQHEMMNVVAQSLDEKSIELLSNWYAAKSLSITLSADKQSNSVIDKCVQCHGADGIAITAKTPHLAGESVIYIDTQLKAFRNGKRTHEIMSRIAENLTDDQMRQAAQWYANIEVNVEE